jgi:hypothetical protein
MTSSASQVSPFSRFHDLLKQKGYPCDSQAINELEHIAKFIVALYLDTSREKPLRPSHVARELKAIAKKLAGVERSLSKLGRQGMLHLLAASRSRRQLDDVDPRPHIAYLALLAQWAKRAADAAQEINLSRGDNRGGRTGNENLRRLVAMLLQYFREVLGIEPTHTINLETGFGESVFDWFVKEALREFAPAGVVFESHQIDDAIRLALPIRDLEPFTPPPFTEE